VPRREAEEKNPLVALVVRLARIFQETSILDSDLVTDLWDRSAALLKNSLGNTHDCCCGCEVACDRESVEVGKIGRSSSESIEEHLKV
jgi:hypothetical protein